MNLASASTVFKAQVFATGEILYCVNQDFLDTYRMTMFSIYAKLNKERQEILKNIEENGGIYEK